MDQRFGATHSRGTRKAVARTTIQIRHGCGRGSLDGRHFEVRFFTASKIATHGISSSGKELEQVSFVGRVPRESGKPEFFRQSRIATCETASLDAARRRAL